MKIILCSFLMLISSICFAENVELDITAKWSKKDTSKVINTMIVAKLGKEFIVPFENNNSMKFKMLLTQDDLDKFNKDSNLNLKDSVLIKGKFFVLEDGIEKNISNPEVLTTFGKDAQIVISSDGETFEMNIKPKRKI